MQFFVAGFFNLQQNNYCWNLFDNIIPDDSELVVILLNTTFFLLSGELISSWDEEDVCSIFLDRTVDEEDLGFFLGLFRWCRLGRNSHLFWELRMTTSSSEESSFSLVVGFFLFFCLDGFLFLLFFMFWILGLSVPAKF